MEPIRTLIVDDEPLARENLRIRLRGAPDFLVVGECGNGADAIAAIRKDRPDLVFLDVRMPDMDGFGVIDGITPDLMPVVVFVTAYDRHALDAFRVHALDYLLKPIDPERFAETIGICRRRIAEIRRAGREKEPVFDLGGDTPARAAGRRGGTPPPHPDRLVIRSHGRVLFIRAESIDWVEAYGDYVCLHVGETSHLLHQTMTEMETRLGPAAFARVHRSAIVNLNRVQELRSLARGEYAVRLTCGREIKLTRSHRGTLERLLADRH